MDKKDRCLRKIMVLIIFTAEVSAAGICGFGAPFQDKPAYEKWAEDVDTLAEKLPKLHYNLFFKISEKEFREKAADLKQRLPRLNEDEFQVGLSRLVAAVGDSHTGLRPQIIRAFPLMLYWFEDGIYVLNTVPEYEEILYGRITRVQDHSMDEVIEAFSEILPHENQVQLKSSIPQILASAQHLHGLNIIPDTETMRLTVENEQGKTVTADMTSLPLGGMFKGIVDMQDDSGWPLYRQNRGRFYWYEYLPDTKLMYFKYNACREHTAEPFSEFSQRLLAEIEANPVEKLVIDVRNNGGGNSAILDPFIDTLVQHETLNQKGRLFVIIGRQTFSSAILNAIDLRKKTEAILAGEPTGGKPNHFGELEYLTLPNTKMAVSYSTKYFTHAEKDTPSLMPDIAVEMTFEDHRTGRDPFLEAVLE